jgi:hypothetical protein
LEDAASRSVGREGFESRLSFPCRYEELVPAMAVSACCFLSAFLIQQRAWATFCFFRFSSVHGEDRRRRSVLDWRYCSLAERWVRRAVAGSVSGVGVVGAVVATEIATAALIVVACFTPITAMLVVLPLLGMVLNGTSSVLYGTVPELAPKGITGRAFSVVLYRSHWLRRSRANRLRGNRRPFQPDDRHSFVGVHGGGHRTAGL